MCSASNQEMEMSTIVTVAVAVKEQILKYIGELHKRKKALLPSDEMGAHLERQIEEASQALKWLEHDKALRWQVEKQYKDLMNCPYDPLIYGEIIPEIIEEYLKAGKNPIIMERDSLGNTTTLTWFQGTITYKIIPSKRSG